MASIIFIPKCTAKVMKGIIAPIPTKEKILSGLTHSQIIGHTIHVPITSIKR